MHQRDECIETMYTNPRAVQLSEGLVCDPTLQEIEAAWEAYRCTTSGPAGIVDYLSFEVMRQLGIREAFTMIGISNLLASPVYSSFRHHSI
jgi:hypothetical protein